MKQSQPKHLTIMAFVLMMLAAFLVGYQSRGGALGTRPVWAALAIPGTAPGMLDTSISLKPVQLFREALDHLQREYVDPVANTDELVYSAIRGMLLPLNDPYTRFMDPKEYRDFNTDNVGHFAGIGATLNLVEIPGQEAKNGEGTVAPVTCPVCGTSVSDAKHYRVAIVEPMPGSPAKAAGLLPGDFIMKIDDVSTDGMTVSDAANKIRGPVGRKVMLTIARKGSDKTEPVTITRAEIEVPATESKVLDDQIGYLRLMTFNEKTASETRAALARFEQDKVRGVVLDLRNNPGGLMRECIKIASMLLPADNKLIVSTKSRNKRTDEYNRLERQLCEVPLVVLVNKGSASASEILSGALKDYKRARLVGETTFGKALVQSVIPLSDGSAMAVTTAHYYTPTGFDLAKKGIAPDIEIALDKEVKTLSEKDNQALTAIRILKDTIAKAR